MRVMYDSLVKGEGISRDMFGRGEGGRVGEGHGDEVEGSFVFVLDSMSIFQFEVCS